METRFGLTPENTTVHTFKLCVRRLHYLWRLIHHIREATLGSPTLQKGGKGQFWCLNMFNLKCKSKPAPTQTHSSPANRTVRKILDDVSSPAWVQAPVEGDRYQGVATQWYSPLSLDTTEHTHSPYNDDRKERTFSERHSPVLRAVNAQRVGVRVPALHRNIAGRVPGFSPHHAEAVDAGHLGRRLSTAQPGEEPAHLVRQVVRH